MMTMIMMMTMINKDHSLATPEMEGLPVGYNSDGDLEHSRFALDVKRAITFHRSFSRCYHCTACIFDHDDDDDNDGKPPGLVDTTRADTPPPRASARAKYRASVFREAAD